MPTRALIKFGLIVCAVVLCFTSMATASAAPLGLPGPGFGSSGPAAPGGQGNFDSRIVVAARSNGLPAGTTITQVPEADHCANPVNNDGFTINHCLLSSEYWARYRFTVTTPDGRVATKVITFDGSTFDEKGRATEHVEAFCLGGGNMGCLSDGRVSGCPGCALFPGAALGPLPQGLPSTRFCAQEGQTCRAPAGTAVTFGVGSDAANYATTSMGSSGNILCAASSFAGRDPAADRLKDCYTAVAPPPPPPPPSRKSEIFIEAGALDRGYIQYLSVTPNDGPGRECVDLAPLNTLPTYAILRVGAELKSPVPASCSAKGADVTFTVRTPQGQPLGLFTAYFGAGQAEPKCLESPPPPSGLSELRCERVAPDRLKFSN